jgi:hypothetical protein
MSGHVSGSIRTSVVNNQNLGVGRKGVDQLGQTPR